MISFFFNLAEKNLLIVEKFSKCRENGIASFQKGQLRSRLCRITKCLTGSEGVME